MLSRLVTSALCSVGIDIKVELPIPANLLQFSCNTDFFSDLPQSPETGDIKAVVI